ncbi:hypothetical protein LX36DRAFT_684302 [Colletotrichum falcatum]|nr:hypothetical protein LX36DRAFT_684302 [Colletotrichum falcatum]
MITTSDNSVVLPAGGSVQKSENDTIVVVIRFSGVSWAFSGQPNSIEVITRWPSDMNFNSDTEKTPSELLYHGLQDEPLWGYCIPAEFSDVALRWFKLLLIDNRDLSHELQKSPQIITAKRLLSASNKDTVDVVSAYLRRLWNHAVDCISQSTGKGLVRLCKFHVVVTLPAIWPDYAKARMRRAVANAGILESRLAGETVLSFISEPEAAALATMCDFGYRPDIKKGDHFIICDAGGGTVDLISYEITETSPMTVRESVKGNGRLCGGVFLDQAFIELMRSKVTPSVWDTLPKDQVRRLLNGDWEHGIKKQFRGQQKDWVVTLPPECGPKKAKTGRFQKQVLVLSHKDLDPVFQGIAKQVAELIEEQVQQVQQQYNKMPKYIILVGGFGRSVYLYDHIAQGVADRQIEVLQSQGSRPWSAVCRGSVIQGLARRNPVSALSVTVKSRVARVNYGTVFCTDFNPKVHSSIDRTWSEDEMEWKADNQVEWYLKQGTDIFDAKPVRHSFYRLYNRPPEAVTENLYYSASLIAPTRRDDTVKRLCTITWNEKIDFEALPKFINPAGKVYYRLTFDLDMVPDGSSLEFTVLHNGKQVGVNNVSVDFDLNQ